MQLLWSTNEICTSVLLLRTNLRAKGVEQNGREHRRSGGRGCLTRLLPPTEHFMYSLHGTTKEGLLSLILQSLSSSFTQLLWGRTEPEDSLALQSLHKPRVLIRKGRSTQSQENAHPHGSLWVSKGRLLTTLLYHQVPQRHKEGKQNRKRNSHP